MSTATKSFGPSLDMVQLEFMKRFAMTLRPTVSVLRINEAHVVGMASPLLFYFEVYRIPLAE